MRIIVVLQPTKKNGFGILLPIIEYFKSTSIMSSNISVEQR